MAGPAERREGGGEAYETRVGRHVLKQELRGFGNSVTALDLSELKMEHLAAAASVPGALLLTLI